MWNYKTCTLKSILHSKGSKGIASGYVIGKVRITFKPTWTSLSVPHSLSVPLFYSDRRIIKKTKVEKRKF